MAAFYTAICTAIPVLLQPAAPFLAATAAGIHKRDRYALAVPARNLESAHRTGQVCPEPHGYQAEAAS